MLKTYHLSTLTMPRRNNPAIPVLPLPASLPPSFYTQDEKPGCFHRVGKRIANTWVVKTVHWLFRGARQLTYRALPVVNGVLEEQYQVENTFSYGSYALCRHLLVPAMVLPLSVTVPLVSWRLLVWTSLLPSMPFLPKQGRKLLQLLLYTLRFIDDEQTAMLGIVSLLLMCVPFAHNSIPRGVRALLYILIRDFPVGLEIYENYLIMRKYQTVLGISAYDLCAESATYFQVITNAQHPCLAGDIFFAENHSNLTHNQLQSLFISTLAAVNPRHVQVVLEGVASMSEPPCSDHSLKNHLDNSTGATVIFHGTELGAIRCTGWDNLTYMSGNAFIAGTFNAIITSLEKLNALEEKVKKTHPNKDVRGEVMYQECRALLDPYTVHSEAIFAMKMTRSICAHYGNAATSDMSDTEFNKGIVDFNQNIHAILNKKVYTERNQVAVETLRALLRKRGWMFFAGTTNIWGMGRRHLIPDHAGAASSSAVQPEDLSYELRLALNQTDHTIFRP
jgi:hypothetical protein